MNRSVNAISLSPIMGRDAFPLKFYYPAHLPLLPHILRGHIRDFCKVTESESRHKLYTLFGIFSDKMLITVYIDLPWTLFEHADCLR